MDEAVEEAAVRRWCENAGVNALLDFVPGRASAPAPRWRAVRRAARPAGERA
ncbi:MAG: hypothetical protein ACLSVD_05695 [Eggerthellaceae bacterium]